MKSSLRPHNAVQEETKRRESLEYSDDDDDAQQRKAAEPSALQVLGEIRSLSLVGGENVKQQTNSRMIASGSKSLGSKPRRNVAIGAAPIADPPGTNDKDAVVGRTAATTTNSTKPTALAKKPQAIIKNQSPDTRYCPAGHVMASLDLYTRQKRLQLKNVLPTDVLPIVSCDVCSEDIHDQIAGCCSLCDIDICQSCMSLCVRGKTVKDLLAESAAIASATIRENNPYHHHHLSQSISASASLSSNNSNSHSNSQGSMTFISTKEFCGAGHEILGKVPTIKSQLFLQELHGLASLPSIPCDCCSRNIRDEFIAGCCTECQLHFCDDCFMKGQSYEDVLEDHYLKINSNNATLDESDLTSQIERTQQRYNGQRPTYKGTGRVNYDDYPDPTVFGFTFTGSGSSVEYFEKKIQTKKPNGSSVIRLNFNFTTGIAKTFLYHPTNGSSMVLFDKASKSLSSQSYKKLLTDPFSYTNRCFKRKSSKKQLL